MATVFSSLAVTDLDHHGIIDEIAAYTWLEEMACQDCISSITRSVILAIISFDTDA